MKRLAILSTDNNPGYHFYLPIVEWAWNKFGWDVAVFHTSDCDDLVTHNPETKRYVIPDIEGVRSNTLAQVVRHFVSDVLPKEDYIMVQDIDLIPLKEYNPDLSLRTIWGWDLTAHSFIPVHYTGMTGDKWYEIMDCTGDLKADMEREMKANGRAYQKEWEGYWDTDWDILSQKVKAKKHLFTFIERGMVQLADHQTPRGRIDRYSIEVKDGKYSYGKTRNHPELIDMHCENHNPSSPEKWENIREVLVSVFGELPEWMDGYVAQHYAKYKRG